MKSSLHTRKRRGNSRYYLFFLVSLLLISGFGYGLWYALTHVNFFATQHLVINGNTAIPDSLIQKVITPYMGSNLLAIPSSQLRGRLLKFSRVADVKIRKKLLHTLQLDITERKGMLYVKSFEGNLFPVDSHGIIMAQYSPIYTEDLPIFSTYFSSASLKPGIKLQKPALKRILALHQRIAKEAPGFLPYISEYYLIDNTVNIVDARHGTRIIPSEADLARQLKRYLFVQENGNINRRGVVDLRYKNQVVVKAGEQ